LLILIAYFVTNNVVLLIVISGVILLQWATDLLDGGLGRYRNTGLVKWGFFADHFLDYAFLASVLLAYHFYLAGQTGYYILFLLVIAFSSFGFMLNSYLYFAVTREFFNTIARIGTSEIRLFLILFNIAAIIFKGILVVLVPYLAVISLVLLVISFYKTQKKLWKIDMKIKKLK